jgi:HEPN domain-containing protein
MATTPENLVSRAAEWGSTARAALAQGSLHAAYDSARQSVELAGKALLQNEIGSFPKRHDIQGLLYQHGLLPPGGDARAFSALLSAWTRGTYGFEEPVSAEEAADAVHLSEKMLAFALAKLSHPKH